MINCYFDGSITKNPGGIMGFGYVVQTSCNGNKTEYFYKSKYGEASDDDYRSSNIAELLGVTNLLIYLIKTNCQNEVINIYGDSQIAVYGASGKYKLKKAHLNKYRQMCILLIRELEAKNNKITFTWISRDKNIADKYSR